MKKVLTMILASILLTGCGGGGSDNVSVPEGEPRSNTLDLSEVTSADTDNGLPDSWYKGAVFMEIYVRGYMDSDGDGIGDFNGLIRQLDYIQDLGVTGIWLMPMMESQDKDHGYAVADYRRIESDYGTQEDFQNFLTEAHNRNIGVIIDYVINHSAAQNPLFLDSADNFPQFRDWYVWSNSNLGWTNWNGDSTWHLRNGDWYYGVFWDQMPDWNLTNPEVIDYHHNNLRYWLNLGVDGFRFDAVGNLVENGQNAYTGQEENHPILANSRAILENEYSNRYLICEEPGDPARFSEDDSCGSTFAFRLNYYLMDSVQNGRVSSAIKNLNYPLERMGIILSNHDSFAGDRIIHQVNANLGQYKVAAATVMTFPGQPFIYYGEEVGMGHSRNNSDDRALRAPMSWRADGGFTTGTPFRNHAINMTDFNAEDQIDVDGSLHSTYKALISTRNNSPALKYGEINIIMADEVIAYTRVSESQEVLVVINYNNSGQPRELVLNQPGSRWGYLYPNNGGELVSNAEGNIELSLEGYEIAILEKL